MYCDLNVPCPNQVDRLTIDKLKIIFSRLTEFHDCTVALNYTLTNVNHYTKIKKLNKDLFDSATLNTNYKLKIYTRVTIETNESVKNSDIIELRKMFDVIAIRTNNLETFKESCQIYNIDIISLYTTERLAFELNPVDIQKAIERDIYFELPYSPAIRDNQFRIFTLSLAKSLVDYTKGHHLIISSEAENVSEIRSPSDIYYFAKSIGLANDKAKFTTEKYAQQLLYRLK